MILLVNCYFCEQPVELANALVVETDADGSQGYFTHDTCYHNYELLEGGNY